MSIVKRLRRVEQLVEAKRPPIRHLWRWLDFDPDRTVEEYLYRQAKWGEIEINKGSKLASILAVGLTAAKMERDDEVERRLSEIESSLAHEADLDERDGGKVLPFALRART